MTGKYFFNYFQYQDVRWVCFHAELLVQQQRRNLRQTTTTTSRFKLKDKCRSAKWELHLYGDHDHQGGP